jgi:hypothetical protein
MARKFNSIINWLIRGKDGHIYLAQVPNIPIVGWAILAVMSKFAATGQMRAGLSNLSLAFLAIWSYLEITQGASRIRRILGAVVAVLVLRGFL